MAASSPSEPVELSVVMPAFDEETVIRDVVEEWIAALSALGVPYELRVYDDGSRDATGTILDELGRRHRSLVVTRQRNRGHGPTVLRGYVEARGAWILQVDGDGEIAAAHVSSLWARREAADLVLGYRVGRSATMARRVITAVSRWSVRALFGGAVVDANTPYRLYRRAALQALVAGIPPDVFAPNVILTGRAVRAGMRVVQVPVPHRGRRTGGGHLGSLGAWRAAARAFGETWRAARAAGARGESGHG